MTEIRLTIKVAKKLYTQVKECMRLVEDISIDLLKVEYVDTAGIALILAWWQHASSNDVVCHFKTNDVIEAVLRSYQIELP